MSEARIAAAPALRDADEAAGESAPGLPRARRMDLHGWGHFPVERCDVYRPERLAQLCELVARAPQPHLIARGLGRAYGDAALNGGAGVLLSERFDRMLDFDAASGSLWCESGVSMADIIDTFLPRGFFFPVTPGTKHISIGGAIAADVHGKNHHRDGSISAWLDSFRLLLANGEILSCSREENSDAFWATVGGMGLTGIVLDAHLRLKPVENAFVEVEYEKARDLDALLESFSTARDPDPAYSVAWIDCLSRGSGLGRGVIMRADHARSEQLPEAARRAPFDVRRALPLSVPFHLPGFTLNPLTIRIFNAGFYHGHRDGRFVTDCNSFFYPLDRIAHWNRGYGKRGVLQYQAVIPFDHARGGVREMIEETSRARLPSFLGVLKPFGEAGPGLLSFPRPGMTLSLDLPNIGPALVDVVRRLDAIVLRNGGSVYLAKDSVLEAESLPAMYPELDRFRAVKHTLDPQERFQSSLARRLGIVEGGA